MTAPGDPGDELFDLVDEAGAPLGVAKPRRLVHRDGDWHRSLHLWVLLDDPRRGPLLVFQRRSAGKDTWPGRLDVAVTGHYRAGETLADALREAEEEIGLRVEPRDATVIGVRRREDRGTAGVIDREVQEILATRAALALEALRPDPDELEAILGVPLEGALDVLSGRAEDTEAVCFDGVTVCGAPFVATGLVPAPDGYYACAAANVEAWIRGTDWNAFALPAPHR